MNTCIYLDNAATSFPKPESVYEGVSEVNRKYGVCAGSGSYNLAGKAKKLIEKTKDKIRAMLHVKQYGQILFMPSATVAFQQIINAIEWNVKDVVYISPYEHNCVLYPLYRMQKRYHFKIQEMPLVKEDLTIDLVRLSNEFLQNPPMYVICTHISNVTGYILPIRLISELCKTYKSLFIVDASLSVGLIPIDLEKIQVDFLIFTGHKFLYGPFGAAGIVINIPSPLDNNERAGYLTNALNIKESLLESTQDCTLNVSAILGVGAGIDFLNKRSALLENYRSLSKILVEGLRNMEGITLYLPQDEYKHIGIISFNVDGFSSNEIGMILDEDYHIAVRTGYHDATNIHRYLSDERFMGVVRVSFGAFSTNQDVRILLYALREIVCE